MTMRALESAVVFRLNFLPTFLIDSLLVYMIYFAPRQTRRKTRFLSDDLPLQQIRQQFVTVSAHRDQFSLLYFCGVFFLEFVRNLALNLAQQWSETRPLRIPSLTISLASSVALEHIKLSLKNLPFIRMTHNLLLIRFQRITWCPLFCTNCKTIPEEVLFIMITEEYVPDSPFLNPANPSLQYPRLFLVGFYNCGFRGWLFRFSTTPCRMTKAQYYLVQSSKY